MKKFNFNCKKKIKEDYVYIPITIIVIILVVTYICTSNEALLGILGTVIGSLVSGVFTWNSKKQELFLEKEKIKADYRVERFHKVLLPAKQIYFDSYEYSEHINESNINRTIGLGLTDSHAEQLRKLFDSNIGLLNKELYI